MGLQTSPAQVVPLNDFTTAKMLRLTVALFTVFLTAQAVNLCWDCHSGGQSYEKYDACHFNGSIEAGVNKVDCKGPCVTRLRRYPLGSVYRACSDIYWPPKGQWPKTGNETVR